MWGCTLNALHMLGTWEMSMVGPHDSKHKYWDGVRSTLARGSMEGERNKNNFSFEHKYNSVCFLIWESLRRPGGKEGSYFSATRLLTGAATFHTPTWLLNQLYKRFICPNWFLLRASPPSLPTHSWDRNVHYFISTPLEKSKFCPTG